MKTKTIPFDLETAKKIQAGEIKGRVKIDGYTVYIEKFDLCFRNGRSIIAWFRDNMGIDRLLISNNNGGTDCGRLHIELEVPDEPQFKPFDKVLVTQNCWHYWIPSLYRNETPDGKHICIDNLEYDKCIPYEGNEHLLGTTNKPKEVQHD